MPTSFFIFFYFFFVGRGWGRERRVGKGEEGGFLPFFFFFVVGVCLPRRSYVWMEGLFCLEKAGKGS